MQGDAGRGHVTQGNQRRSNEASAEWQKENMDRRNGMYESLGSKEECQRMFPGK